MLAPGGERCSLSRADASRQKQGGEGEAARQRSSWDGGEGMCTARTLLHCMCPARTLPCTYPTLHAACMQPACSLHVPCMCPACALRVPCVCLTCSLRVSCACTARALRLPFTRPACAPHVPCPARPPHVPCMRHACAPHLS